MSVLMYKAIYDADSPRYVAGVMVNGAMWFASDDEAGEAHRKAEAFLAANTPKVRLGTKSKAPEEAGDEDADVVI